MATHLILRMVLVPLLPFSLYSAALGAANPGAPPKSVDYKRADTNFYAKGDVLKSDSTAVILPPTAFAQNGDTYTYTPKKKAPKTIYVEAPSDWIEPITPPDMPASLNIPPDAMQIREPQGDVQIAQPNAPTTFAPVTDGMMVPNGAVIKTGTNATAAILFGGVDSARLMPDSEAAVQQNVTAQSRSVEVDLTAGGVFSKVGTQTGVKGEYQVHTPSGNILAQAGDFAAVVSSGSADAWVSLGTVELLQPDGKKFGTATGDGTGPLKLIRYPAIANAAQSQQADSESLTAILNFIPVANQKLAALHAKQAKGTDLTANEQAYLQRIKLVPALIKLALVEPPPPPPPAPVAPAPPPVATKPAPAEPVAVIVHANGTIKFQGATMGLEEFQTKIKALVAANPDASVIIHSNPKMEYGKFEAVVQACKTALIKEVAVVPPAPQPPPSAPPLPAAPPAVAATPAASVAPANPDVSIVPPTAPKPQEPVTALVHEDGTVGFKGTRTSFAEFKAKLAAMVKTTPTREVVIKASSRQVPYAHVKAVLDACADAHVAHVSVEGAVPSSPPPVTAETPPAPPTPVPATPAAPATAETPPAPAPAPPPPTAETPPTPAAPVNNKPVPAEIDLAADGTLLLDGTAVTEDDLNAKLADIAKTHPKNPLVMIKHPKVTKAQWMHYVDLCHSMGLKLTVKNTKPAAAPATPSPVTAETPPPPAQPAAESGSLAPAPHLAAAPAPEEAVPVEIELTPDGQTSFLGENVSDADLKTRLEGVAKAGSGETVLIVKDEKVTQAQWQKIVDLCHSVGLKVHLKTVKSTDSTSLHASHSGAGVTANNFRNAAPVLDATLTSNKIIPVEIGLATTGRLTFEGESVNLDELKARLATVVKTNPSQPVVIVKKSDVPDDSAEALVTLCEAANVKVTVRTEPAFTPPDQAESSPDAALAPNLPTPDVHMRASMDAPPATPAPSP